MTCDAAQALREAAADVLDVAEDHRCFRPTGCYQCGQRDARESVSRDLLALADRLPATDAVLGEDQALASVWDQGLAAGSALASHPEAHRLIPLNPYRAAPEPGKGGAS